MNKIEKNGVKIAEITFGSVDTDVKTYCIELGEEDGESYDCIFSSQDFDTEEEALDWGNNIAYYPKHLKMYLAITRFKTIEDYKNGYISSVDFRCIAIQK